MSLRHCSKATIDPVLLRQRCFMPVTRGSLPNTSRAEPARCASAWASARDCEAHTDAAVAL